MGLFKKKEADKIPKLPELPRLPELKGMGNLPEPMGFNMEEDSDGYLESPSLERAHKLPVFPNNPTAEKFSQNTIKHAIGNSDEFNISPEPGKMTPPKEFPSEEDFGSRIIEPPQTMAKNPSTNKTISREKSFEEPTETGPVFIRIDKFEESIKFIKKTKEKISEVEELLAQTKELKDKEGKELMEWEEEMKELKSKIERIERDLTSKI